MKKFILSTIIAICAIPLYADNNGGKSKDDDKYAIVLITTDKPPIESTRSRSAIGMPVSAYLDCEMGQIEVAFDIPEGMATTTIVNALGQAVYQYTCDSETEWLIYLPLPADEGCYTLRISTAEAEYEGSFTL